MRGQNKTIRVGQKKSTLKTPVPNSKKLAFRMHFRGGA